MPPIPSKPVLDSRRFGRTPAAFLTGLAACSLIAILALVIVVAHRGSAPALVGLLLAMLPIPLLVALILLIDRLEPEPRALLLAIFGAGAGVAVIIALLGHAAGTAAIAIPELGPHAGRGVSIGIGAAIGAAAVAESLKGLVLLALLPSRRTEIDGATDGVVYASMIGLGFALVANVYAYAAAWEAGIRPLAEEFARRGGILGPLWEALFTSMIGLGIAYAAARKGSTGYWAIGAGWVVAVALDAMWIKSVTEGGASLAVTYAILVVALAVVASLVAADWRRVVAMINSFLPQFADPRTVATSDLHMLTSLRIRRLGRQWARLNVGIDAMHAMTQYQLAATELAMACNRNAHGRLTPEHFARHRDDSLTLMREAVTLIRGREQLFPPPWVGDDPSAFVRS
ncbi:MAG TPA: PrsW family glutamic-type intramembrane protease [Trebonia sp.]|nr:PrsW family glutamic-type intramembrane protease [Trebonia sp.]